MKKSIFSVIWAMIISSLFFGNPVSSQTATINQEFQPNYLINDSWDAILDDFVKLEALSKVGKDPDENIFFDLNQNFQKVFPNLSQKKTYKIVYEQCNILSEDLMEDYSYTSFTNFQNNCQKEINKVMKEINSNFTIKANVKVQPSWWPAPLTVTLDGRESTDPSADTIPSDNFFWWYKDNKGIDREIGKWSVLYYTFKEEGKYYVHLTVRSANNLTEWVLDGSKTFTIDVTPKSANLVVYVWGTKMEEWRYTKVWFKEAQNGLFIDGSATTAKGWRKILYHTWEITSWNWFDYTTNKKNWKPDNIKVNLPDHGEYAITLTTIDNESNEVSQKYLLKISDPISTITMKPENWDTNSEFAFDGNKSYSIQSRIKLYTWEIFDDAWDKIYTEQKAEIRKKFEKPGDYIVKLTVTDEAWEKDQEALPIHIASTPPDAQFTIKPLAERDLPSQFMLDASKSTDIDVNNNVDNLTYTWIFSDNNYTKTDKTYDDWKRTIISFDKKWTYEVTLEAKDSFGEVNKITKEIEIKSSLRPIIIAAPKAIERWKDIIFVAKANKDILNYDWDFWDWITRSIQSNNIKHKYEEAWTYQVSLIATTKNWETNKISTLVFAWEKNKPIAAYKVKDKLLNIIRQKETCQIDWEDWELIDVPAYSVERYEDFNVDILDSVNVKWKKQNLKSYFQPNWEEIYTKQNFKYHFNDLGCKYIDIFVEDTDANKNDSKRIWFKVFNWLPTIEKVELAFPQYGNEVWIWFQNEQSKVNILSDTKFDPLIVKVEAIGANDPDWSISYYTRYYYDKNNPDHIFESRISPGSAPYAYFSLPKTIPWEYVFGVRMTDNDDWEVASEEIIGQSAVIPFFPDEKNLDIPMATLIADRINIKAWDEVTFTVKAKILSQRKDFNAKKTNKFDFDGDGEIDLITKDDVVKYIYKEPQTNWVVPKVEVLYRWYKWTAFWEKITIKNWLKPVILYDIIDKIILLRDNSIWDITMKEICFDHNSCKKDSSFLASEWNVFTFTYPDYWDYILEYQIKDDYWNDMTERHVIKLEKKETDEMVQLVTIPENIDKKGEPVIRVGNSLDNSILMYLKYNWIWDCYADINIGEDSDGDWNADNDRDIECNTPNKLIKYDPSFSQTVWKMYYDDMTVWGTKETTVQNFTIEFIDYEAILNPDEQEKYDTITDIIKNIDSTITWNQNLVAELLSLRKNIQSNVDIANSVITMHGLMDDENLQIKKEVENQINILLTGLSDGWTIAALGWGPYDQAKQEILSILPPNLKVDVKPSFQQIDIVIEEKSLSWDFTDIQKNKIKTLLNNIIKRITQNTVVFYDDQWDDDILKDDFDLIIQPQICEITNYFKIETKTCGSYEDKIKINPTQIAETASSWFGSILKWILIIWGIVLVWFVGIVIFFAIKAKQSEEWEESDEEEE